MRFRMALLSTGARVPQRSSTKISEVPAQNQQLQEEKMKSVGLQRHHGVVVCGSTVAEAFDDLYFLEQAARIQVLAMQTNLPLVLVDEEVCKLTKEVFDKDKPKYARTHLDAWKRQLLREDPTLRWLEPWVPMAHADVLRTRSGVGHVPWAEWLVDFATSQKVRDVLTTALISGTREGHSAENAAKFMELGPERALLTYTRRSGALSAHTSTIDNAWRLLKQAVPKSLALKKGLKEIFGGSCHRTAKICAILDAARLSAERAGDPRLQGCRNACESVEQVLKDLGLGAALRAAQEEERQALADARAADVGRSDAPFSSPKEEEAARKAADDEAARKAAEEEAARKAAEEEAARKAAEEEAARKAAEDEAARKAAEEEAARKAAEDEAARKAAEEEAARKAAEEEAARKAAEEEAARKAAEDEAARKAAEEEAVRKAAEEEAARKAAEEEAARKAAEEEAARKAAEEEAARKAAEAEVAKVAPEAGGKGKGKARGSGAGSRFIDPPGHYVLDSASWPWKADGCEVGSDGCEAGA
ncbi:unnamed protein product [Cladocopium goreaui]|uniref:Kinetoplast DNA-associated protein n=1 Tax=Cladocopium goreaui TaxID=2562237 RepID=A0A9P1C4N4_9DINO|nr:unnamed protein product [Cladocopium goreaui]